MKTQPVKVATQRAKKCLSALPSPICALLVSLFVVTSRPALAVDSVWLPNPNSGDWNDGNNWSTTGDPPDEAPDTATFNTSTVTSLFLSSATRRLPNTTVESITFNSGASAFTINTHGNVLTIEGAGIVNNSGQTQTIINNGATESPNGLTVFTNAATAGNTTIINEGGSNTGLLGGETQFQNTSTAGSATIINEAGTDGGLGGITIFKDTSTAGNATITNSGGTFNGTVGGATIFLNTSTAGNATITNNGGTVTGAFGGFTVFGSVKGVTLFGVTGSGVDTSSAGSATIINNGGTGGGFGGTTEFFAFTDGGTARAITNGNGNFDISRLSSPGMNIGSIEGSGNYFLGSKTLTVGGNNLSTTVSGVIQDGGFEPGVFGGFGTGGSLTKVGKGTLTLTGANTYTGTTTVDAGSLIVDGSIASTQTVVNPRGLLGGTGFIRGNLLNSGTVSPGNPFGTLTVGGNYTQTASGTLRISVGGLAPGQFSLLAINGHATLGGNLQLIRLNNFNLQVGNKITFLTADRGVSGTFSTVQNPFISDTIVKAQVILTPGAVEIEGTQGSFMNIPGLTTSNQRAVANALDSAAGDPREAALFAFLNSQPLSALPHDLTLIAPTQVSSMNATTVSHGRVQASNVGQRLNYIQAGLPSGFSSAGFGITGGAASFDAGFAGVSGPEGKAAPPVFAPTPENRWGVFVTGTGEFTNVDSTPNAAGYNVDTGGITVGVDYRLTPNFVIGLDGGYAHTNVSLDGGGNIDINAGTIGLYATVFGNGFYLNTAVSGGPSGYNTERTGLQGNASGSTNGGNIDFLISGGYDWTRGNLSIGPTATFQFSYVGLDGFTETGSLAPLKFPDQNYESERTIFGAKASYIWKIGNFTLIPQVSAGWVHEYGSVAYSVVANFASGAGNSFTVNGPEIGRDGVLVTAGMSMLWTDRISTYIYYNGELARTNYDSHTVTGGIRVTF